MTRFVIVTHGRSGSTALCQALSQHPRVHAYHEVFHPTARVVMNGHEYEPGADGAEFLRSAVFAQPNEFGKTTVGFKIFHVHARGSDGEFNAWRYLLGDPDVHVISLVRHNLLDAYVSEQRAQATGVWHLAADEEPPAEHGKPFFVDPAKLRVYMAVRTAELAWARSAFRGHPRLEVAYADLERDLPGTAQRVFRFLGEAEAPVRVWSRKVNTIPHEEGVLNYAELRETFRLSIFRDFFQPNDTPA